MHRFHVLVVHNEPTLRRLMLEAVGQEAVRLSFASSVEEGRSLLKEQRVHALVTSFGVEGVDHEFVRYAASIHPFLGVVMIGDAAPADILARSGPPGLVQHVPRAAAPDVLRSAIQRALQPKQGAGLTQSVAAKPPAACGDGGAQAGEQLPRLVAASKAMREILELVRRSAPTDAPVLICGEPDTGKELIAREIHRHSRRAGDPFVRVACGALGESELADRLFGRGTRPAEGSHPVSSPLLEEARGGTLFLENVSQLPLRGQVELLEVLQHGPPLHAGTRAGAAVDVRVIASTTGDLHSASSREGFASSLYYYLNVVEIYVPPLRHRPQDIRPLAEMYLEIANSMRGGHPVKAPCRLTDDAFQCLSEYDWPGNTLQLASVVAHAVLLAEGQEIDRTMIVGSLGGSVPRSDSDTVTVPLVGGLKQIERSIIEAVIERCRGNKAAAARALQLHRRTLYRILQDDVPAKKGVAPLIFPVGPGADTYSADARV